MRVWDAENAIYDSLHALPRRQYLCAMWILATELQLLFEDRLTDPEQSLIAATLDAVRESVITDDTIRDRAEDLASEWRTLIADRGDQVLPGQWNAWITFEDLAAELAGRTETYQATERLTLAVTERWREPYPGKARRIDPNEEIDNGSPMAQTLRKFDRIVTEVARAQPQDWDPARLRERILASDN
jgi:hypothetical protein